MAKLTLNNINSRYASVAALNDNFDLIETALENTLSRDGTTPNTMSANLDMNSKDLLNVGTLNASSLIINGSPVSSSAISYTGVIKETQTATSGQTVFTLTEIQYDPLTNNLSVYIDGVYQNPSTYTETSSSVVTMSTGVHVGAVVDFVVFALNDLEGAGDAANITYTSAGAGAVTTTVQTKLRESVSVKDFGAVGDGVTDDTAAIHDCWNYVATQNGGTVYYPPGKYKVTSLIHPNVMISHVGAQQWAFNADVATTIVGSGSVVWYFSHYSQSQGSAGSNITNINIRGNGTGQTNGTNVALRINTGFISLTNVSCTHSGTALLVNIGVYGTYKECTFYGKDYGIDFTPAASGDDPYVGGQNGGYQAMTLINCSAACNWTSPSSPSDPSYGMRVHDNGAELVQFFAGNTFINFLAANTAGGGIQIETNGNFSDGNVFICPWVENIKPSSYWYYIVSRMTITEPYWRGADNGVNYWNPTNPTVLEFGGSFLPQGTNAAAVLGSAPEVTAGEWRFWAYEQAMARNTLSQRYSLLSGSTLVGTSGYSENPTTYSDTQEIVSRYNSATTSIDLVRAYSPAYPMAGFIEVDFAAYGSAASAARAVSAKRYYESDASGNVTFTTVGSDFIQNSGGITFTDEGGGHFRVTATGLDTTSRISAKVKAYSGIGKNSSYGINLTDLT